MAEVLLRNVTKRFGQTHAVNAIDLAIADGEFVVLLGPTGAGKTTTLRLVAGLERPEEGSILINGRDVTQADPAARDVTFVFQQYSLYPHLSVYDNLAFPLRSPARRVPEDEIRRRVGQVAEVLRIPHKLQNRATQLSGGEMQRVSIARALAGGQPLLLCDEPTGNLSQKAGLEVMQLLRRARDEEQRSVLLVTHNPRDAAFADRVLFLVDGELARAELRGPDIAVEAIHATLAELSI